MSLVVWKKKGGYFISSETRSQWLVKIPTVKNRLHRSGTLGLDMSEKYELMNHKQGVLYVDGTAKKYLLIPTEVLMRYFVKMCSYSGVRDALAQYNVKKIVDDGMAVLLDIKDESKPAVKPSDPVVDQIRAKFGL